MVTSRSRRRVRFTTFRPFVAFLLIASFGLLFGCRGPEDVSDNGSFVFTEKDAARYRELADQARQDAGGTTPHLDSGSGTETTGDQPYLEALPAGSGAVQEIPVLDLSLLPTYKAIRAGGGAMPQGNIFRVTNDVLNVRAQPATGAAFVVRLGRGNLVDVLEFTNASWAKVRAVSGGNKEGFISTQYIARMTTDDKVAEEKKKYDGQYFVNFTFVNVRVAPDQKSEKLGEIPGQAIIRPTAVQGGWAKVPFQGKEGFVSTGYLSPFLPKFLVRQERYTSPVLTYDMSQQGSADTLVAHVAALRQGGYTPLTFVTFRGMLLKQEQQDFVIGPKYVLIALTGVTSANIRDVSDALSRGGVPATLFLQTKDLGLTGITEKMIVTLQANGLDLQSAGHTGDDLRSLTNSQVELELKQSRQLLESYTHSPVFAIAYPQGGINDRVMQIAQEAGYLLGLGNTPDRAYTRDQLLRLPVLVVSPSVGASDIVGMVKGN